MRENLRFLSGIKNKEQQDAIMREYMQKVDLKEELLDRYPGNLSGGQCQRAAIARALMVNPKILLCDEITSALDVIVQDKVVDVIIKLAGELHVAVIFVSHDLALVGSLCDRILVMKDGTAVEQGSRGNSFPSEDRLCKTTSDWDSLKKRVGKTERNPMTDTKKFVDIHVSFGDYLTAKYAVYIKPEIIRKTLLGLLESASYVLQAVCLAKNSRSRVSR